MLFLYSSLSMLLFSTLFAIVLIVRLYVIKEKLSNVKNENSKQSNQIEYLSKEKTDHLDKIHQLSIQLELAKKTIVPIGTSSKHSHDKCRKSAHTTWARIN